MLMLLLEKHLLWTSESPGRIVHYYYYDQVTWVVVTLAVLWTSWLLIRRYRLSRARRRPSRGVNRRLLKRVARIKDELSSRYLAGSVSNNLHAIGIGRLGIGGDYCIQFFVSDATREPWPGAGTTSLPASYGGIPLVVVQMPRATLMVSAAAELRVEQQPDYGPIQDYQEVTIGGISGANQNLEGQSGTIGYFCRSRETSSEEIYLLSNSHVFVDLQNPRISTEDLIIQPSPGEAKGRKETIGTLESFLPLKFANESEPNFIDAALGKLNTQKQQYRAVLPWIGTLKGYTAQENVDVGETARKFGRTTGYTEGHIFSIGLDVSIYYDRVGEWAFFKNQFLIEPTSPAYSDFVSRGDSGSLVVDDQGYAVGLICGGKSKDPYDTQPLQQPTHAGRNVITIKSYGIANPISAVLDAFAIELLTEESHLVA